MHGDLGHRENQLLAAKKTTMTVLVRLTIRKSGDGNSSLRTPILSDGEGFFIRHSYKLILALILLFVFGTSKLAYSQMSLAQLPSTDTSGIRFMFLGDGTIANALSSSSSTDQTPTGGTAGGVFYTKNSRLTLQFKFASSIDTIAGNQDEYATSILAPELKSHTMFHIDFQRLSLDGDALYDRPNFSGVRAWASINKSTWATADSNSKYVTAEVLDFGAIWNPNIFGKWGGNNIYADGEIGVTYRKLAQNVSYVQNDSMRINRLGSAAITYYGLHLGANFRFNNFKFFAQMPVLWSMTKESVPSLTGLQLIVGAGVEAPIEFGN